MRNPAGSICIALGAVVLDTPDRSGCYVAKDLVGGWSYLISDGEGDYRFQGAGSCAGGIDAALRWGLLAALAQVPECRQVRLLVENRQVHRVMVRLAQSDNAAIGGINRRPVVVFTRPEERSVRRATNAAEQAAAVLLRDHERSEAREEAAAAAEQQGVSAGAARRILTDIPLDLHDWRVTRAYAVNSPPSPSRQMVTLKPKPSPARRAAPWVGPVFKQIGLRIAKLRRKRDGNTVIAAWMKDLDMQVASVRSGLEGLGT